MYIDIIYNVNFDVTNAFMQGATTSEMLGIPAFTRIMPQVPSFAVKGTGRAWKRSCQ